MNKISPAVSQLAILAGRIAALGLIGHEDYDNIDDLIGAPDEAVDSLALATDRIHQQRLCILADALTSLYDYITKITALQMSGKANR